MESIDILLATYNGERHLKAQILSILAQTNKEWNLFIHDDGSTDNTIQLIKEFVQKDTRIHLVEDGITKLGPGRNFMHLLKYSKAPFVCFCDQDDYWLEDKLEIMIDLIKKKNNEKPQVIFTNGYTWFPDQKNKIGAKSVSRFTSDIKEVLYTNGGMQGAASIFNRKMRDFIDCSYDYVGMHDQILTLAGVINGTIDFIDYPLFLYRQHNSNVSRHITQSYYQLILEVILRNKEIPVVKKKYYDEILMFYKLFKDSMTDYQIKTVELYLQYPSRSRFNRFFSIMKNGFTIRQSRLQLLFKLLIREYIR